MFRKIILSLALAAGFTLPLAGAVQAGMANSPVGASAQPAATSPLANVAYVWNGRNYCWYTGGWKGPGWYWCGYPWARGLGWGGSYGWNGWGGRFGWGWGDGHRYWWGHGWHGHPSRNGRHWRR